MGKPLEEELLITYLNNRWPHAKVWPHVRLGKLPNVEIPGLDPERSRRMAMPSLPEVDAVVVDGEDVWLIEAKIVRVWENLGKMMLCRTLLPLTPGWENVDMSKVKMLMVVPVASPELLQAAASYDVHVDTFITPRVQEFLEKGWPSQQK